MGTAPGYRDFGRANYEGVARNIGHHGYSWASSTSRTNGMLLEFRFQFLMPDYAVNRAYAFQLRCLSE